MSDEIREAVEKNVKSINRQIKSRAVRVENALRNAELEVLQGKRSGRVYKKPGTYGKSRSQATRKLVREYGNKLKGGQLYRASAPGEAPAKMNGDLRKRWHKDTDILGENKVVAYIQSDMPYSSYLENGTGKIAPRPFVEKIKEKAKPEIERIMNDNYS